MEGYWNFLTLVAAILDHHYPPYVLLILYNIAIPVMCSKCKFEAVTFQIHLIFNCEEIRHHFLVKIRIFAIDKLF